MKHISLVFKIVFFVWIILQIYILCTHWDIPNHDDALAYERLATRCLSEGTWYPNAQNLYHRFIFGPGYVNLLVAIHSLFGAFHYIKILNLILNILLVLEIFILARRLFGEKTAYVSAILYMLIYSNVYVPIAMLTDLPFTFLSVTAILLCMERRLFPILLAGVLIALANWMRPLSIVFLFTIIVWFAVKKVRWTSYVALSFSLLLTVFLIGESAKARTGYFVYQAVSGGYNLAMSSFDEADGLVNTKGLKDSTSHIYLEQYKELTFIEKDRMLKKASIKWIRENPWKYISLIPPKLFFLYCEDTWSERVKPGMGFNTVLKTIRNDKAVFIQWVGLLIAKSMVYYIVLFFFLYYLWANRRNLFREKNIFLLIPLLGTASTLLFVITSRYHYPYLFAITIYAAAGLNEFLTRNRKGRVDSPDASFSV